MENELQFPIMSTRYRDPSNPSGSQITLPRGTIPMAMIKPHEAQAIANHNQTLEKLAYRGGLSYLEAVAVLDDKPFLFQDGLDPMGAFLRLAKLVTDWREKQCRTVKDCGRSYEDEITQDFEEALGPHPTIYNGMWIERVKELRAERDTLLRRVYVPGTWKCDKCSFEQNNRTLHVADGTISAPTIEEAQVCPNDGEVMRKLTWEEAAHANYDACQRFLDERDEARRRYDVARGLTDGDLIRLGALDNDQIAEAMDVVVDDIIKRSTPPPGTDTSH